jgi:hypothetical protein
VLSSPPPRKKRHTALSRKPRSFACRSGISGPSRRRLSIRRRWRRRWSEPSNAVARPAPRLAERFTFAAWPRGLFRAVRMPLIAISKRTPHAGYPSPGQLLFRRCRRQAGRAITGVAATSLPLPKLVSGFARRCATLRPRRASSPSDGRSSLSGQALGTALLVDAMARALLMSQRSNRCSSTRVRFYLHHRLQRFASRPMSVYLSLAKAPRRLAAAATM